MHRSTFDLQFYVARAGDQVFAPPFTLDKEDMLLFALKADKAKLNELLDREVNGPWERAFAHRGLRHRYQAASDWVILGLSEVDELYPMIFEELRAAKGDEEKKKRALEDLVKTFGAMSPELLVEMAKVSASQRELIVMVPLDDLGPDPEANEVVQRASRLWYLPIVLNDLPPAVLAGRELFGYPKLLATFELEDAKHAPTKLIDAGTPWHTLTVKTHAPDRIEAATGVEAHYKLRLVEVLTITRGEGMRRAVEDREDRRVAQEAKKLLNETLEFLFIRQFRDPEFASYASYQAAVTGSVTVATGAFGDALATLEDVHQFQLHFPKLAEHYPAIVEALGILAGDANGVVTPSAGFWATDQKLVVTRGVIEWDKS
jgi:hypothetical protein